MVKPQGAAIIARRTIGLPMDDDSTTADLASALKALAMVLMHQMCGGSSTLPLPESMVNGGVRNTAGGMIMRMSPNEVTGNGHIPAGSSNVGIRTVR